MKKTLAQLDAALDQLALLTERRVSEDPDNPHLIDEFAGIADEIAEAASDADRPHVWGRTQCILRDNGFIPGDELPCSN